MRIVPEPNPGDVPLNEPVGVELGTDEQATVTFTASQRTNQGFILPILAISKYSGSTYEVTLDEDQIYGPAPIPPTDIDDLAVCFVPAWEFDQKIEVTVSNLSDIQRVYHIQPIGFERTGEVEQ
ncbi:hypothetical protein [Halorubrum salinum]|uniref:hypothetical protein n=1 Tax=Halorubrum salinum TaxID=767517 RepID=UPI00211172C5|nr:hypothetical protein [Halorubrum salinum]